MHGTAPAPTCRAPRGAWGGLADVRLHIEKIAKLTAWPRSRSRLSPPTSRAWKRRS